MEGSMNLAEFAEARKSKRHSCKACVAAEQYPELWAEVLTGRRDGIALVTIQEYLETKAPLLKLPLYTLRDHFVFKHEETR